jgi:hypothetical protein
MLPIPPQPTPSPAYVQAGSPRQLPNPGDSHDEFERHFEEPPSVSIMEYIQMSQLVPVATGAMVPGNFQRPMSPAWDPELLAAGNRALAHWFRTHRYCDTL